MSTISESNLPGVGRKFQIEAVSGDRLTIVIHDDGTRELYHFARNAPDRVASVVTLSDSEARQVAGIIGGLTYVPKALPSAEIVLEDLLLQWYTIQPGAACIGKTIGDLQVRRLTDASIVSIIEPDRTKRLNPGPDTFINEGATLILAGDRRTIDRLKHLLVHGRAE
ncbi:MAG: cation:proton antiporter regulatory subunit [Chloracidobacterium sp.]|nr:cation:proton antiporter regulatory subunit [Chloracidobacterium sp.]